mmetsp:Transcript_33478/g.38784  ORF Transcript_33478/g.38784 Transcript_33478/m.38784 type:complete len:80 (+) Transcript_33478:98-337(+)
MTFVLARSSVLMTRSLRVANNKSVIGSVRNMGHDHKVFEPPYNKAVLSLLASVVFFGGCGSMCYGVVHQQYKQGFWKKQ